jgi:hypothetical protein
MNYAFSKTLLEKRGSFGALAVNNKFNKLKVI